MDEYNFKDSATQQRRSYPILPPPEAGRSRYFVAALANRDDAGGRRPVARLLVPEDAARLFEILILAHRHAARIVIVADSPEEADEYADRSLRALPDYRRLNLHEEADD